MFDQLPYQTYPGNNYARLKAIQRKYDPNGFFATRTGGFKYNLGYRTQLPAIDSSWLFKIMNKFGRIC